MRNNLKVIGTEVASVLQGYRAMWPTQGKESRFLSPVKETATCSLILDQQND
jgi:hypothetical protein